MTRQTNRFSILLPWLTASLVALGLAGGASITTAAAQEMEVTFSNTPLFLDADVLPGDSVTRTVTVQNGTANSEPISVTSQNTFDTGLATVMNLTIEAGGTQYYAGSFADFFATPRTALGDLAPGADKTWEFTASLPESVGNTYQTSTFGFDLVLGWSDGTITDTPNGNGDTTTISGRGGGSATRLSDEEPDFRLFNEEVLGVDAAAQAVTLGFNTNLPGTTFVVCGNLAGGPFTLDPTADRFGYQFVVPEETVLTVIMKLPKPIYFPASMSVVRRRARAPTMTLPWASALPLPSPMGRWQGRLSRRLT